MVTNEEIHIVQHKLSNMMYDNWIHYDLFTWQWWLLLALAIIPWIIWWKVVDKRRIHEILLFGFFVALIGTFLDVYGWNRQAWVYPIQLLPMCTPLIPFDFTILPVTQMLIYQYYRNWKSFILAEIVVALFFAFISEPLLMWSGIYKAVRWKHLYSPPFYVGKALLGKWIIEKTKKPNTRNGEP